MLISFELSNIDIKDFTFVTDSIDQHKYYSPARYCENIKISLLTYVKQASIEAKRN